MMSDLMTADQRAYFYELVAEQRRKWLAHEIDAALIRAPNDLDLLALKGSLGDTLSDKEVLQLLKDWNETGKVLNERQ
jgi:hypothetical protein